MTRAGARDATLRAMRTVRMGIAAAVLATALLGRAAEAVEVGEPAPPLPQEGWLNVGKGEEPPTAERLKGKVVLVDAWFLG